MPLSTCTITGQWLPPVDLPVATGRVRIQPVAPAAGGGYLIAGEPVWADLVGGAISETIVSSAAAAPLQYLIDEHIARADNPPPYVISPTGPTVDLPTAHRSVWTSGSWAETPPTRRHDCTRQAVSAARAL